jgi:hypothetical protein
MMCVKFPYLLVLIAVFGELSEIISVGEFRRDTGILKRKIVNNIGVLYFAVFIFELFNLFSVQFECRLRGYFSKFLWNVVVRF